MLLKHVRSVLCHNIQVIFKKNPTLSLPKVYRLIDSAISKRQGDQRKHIFFEKKILHKRKNEFTMNTMCHITLCDYKHPEISSCYEAIDSSVLQNIFSYLKMFSMQCRKNITVEDSKKEWIQLTLYIYIYIICEENDSK